MNRKYDHASEAVAPYGEDLQDLVYHELHSLFPVRSMDAVNEYLREDREWMED
jgi:hypothetical protein